MCLNVQKWILCTVSEKENVYSVYFLVFNQNIEIERKLLINSLLDVKTYFYFLNEDGFDVKIL